MLIVCMISNQSVAQDEEAKPQMLLIHTDHVLPSAASDYEETAKNLSTLLKENSIQDLEYFAFTQSDGDYLYVNFIESFADLDKNPFDALKEKLSDDEWENIWKGFNDAYLSHSDKIVYYHPGLSYKAEKLQEGDNSYRVWFFCYFEEKHWDAVKSVSNKWVELYEKYNIESGYTTYTSGFGFDGPFIVFHMWAKSPVDFYTQEQNTWKTTGEDGKKLWEETAQYFYKTEKIDGWFRPDLSYIMETEEIADADNE